MTGGDATRSLTPETVAAAAAAFPDGSPARRIADGAGRLLVGLARRFDARLDVAAGHATFAADDGEGLLPETGGRVLVLVVADDKASVEVRDALLASFPDDGKVVPYRSFDATPEDADAALDYLRLVLRRAADVVHERRFATVDRAADLAVVAMQVAEIEAAGEGAASALGRTVELIAEAFPAAVPAIKAALTQARGGKAYGLPGSDVGSASTDPAGPKE